MGGVSTHSAGDGDATAVVLCGGGSTRFGSDKTRAELGGQALLDALLLGLPEEWAVLCVGEERPTARQVQWCREQPPGGGPVAAVAAALPRVTSSVVVLLGGDMPYAGPPAAALAARLRAEPGVEAVAARDGDGRVQPLLAAYRTGALRAVVPAEPAGTPLMRLLDGLRGLTVDVSPDAALDVDTRADLERARHRLEP